MSANFPMTRIEPVGLVELGDLLLELEVLEYLPRLGRETLDVVRQVLRGLVGFALELLEVQLAGVVEGVARDLVQDRLRLFDLAVLQRGVLFQHLGLGRLQDAIQAPQHGERQDDAAVLVRFVRTAQQVGDRPDKCHFLRKVAHSTPWARVRRGRFAGSSIVVEMFGAKLVRAGMQARDTYHRVRPVLPSNIGWRCLEVNSWLCAKSGKMAARTTCCTCLISGSSMRHGH